MIDLRFSCFLILSEALYNIDCVISQSYRSQLDGEVESNRIATLINNRD